MPNDLSPNILADGVARERERRAITGVPTSTWYLLQSKNLVPKPFPLGSARSVGWSRRELLDWVEQQRAKRGDAWQSLGDVADRVVAKVRRTHTTEKPHD